jgi:hypothetical protein
MNDPVDLNICQHLVMSLFCFSHPDEQTAQYAFGLHFTIMCLFVLCILGETPA